MERIAFTMKVKEGRADEYKCRHDTIWPELSSMLSGIGVSHYSIFLDEPNGTLFGYLQIDDPGQLDKLRVEPLMWKWWSYMADIMETNPDQSPASRPLREVFYLP